MKNFQVRTKTEKSNIYKYESNVINAIVFMRHEEDKICFRSGTESDQIDIYQNGELLFSGCKYDLYDQLKKVTT